MEMYGLCPGTKKTVRIKRVSVMRGLLGVGEGSESFLFDDMEKFLVPLSIAFSNPKILGFLFSTKNTKIA